MKITPKTHVLRSYRGVRVDHSLLISEAIDNAFDAGATRIEVTIAADSIVIADNGIGISFDRIEAFFTLGQHSEMSTTRLGRFGIGLKAQAINAGDVLTVVSTSHDGRLSARADWQTVMSSGEWEVPDPVKSSLRAIDAINGTLISIERLRQPPKLPPDRVRDEIAKRFFPALVEGRDIILNGMQVRPIEDPLLSDLVERQIDLPDGRGVYLRAGIKLETAGPQRIYIGFGHRVIMPHSTIGCGDYSSLKRLFGRLQLTGQWALGQFKEDLVDEDERTMLADAVEPILQPLLEKLRTASDEIRVDDMFVKLNETVPETIRARPKAQRKREPKEEKRSTGTGNVDAQKADVGRGPAKTRRPVNRILITREGEAEKDGIGEFVFGRPHRVNLSVDHPLIAAVLRQADEDFVLAQLRLIALFIYGDGIASYDDEPELPLEPLGLRVARLLALPPVDKAESTRTALT